MNTFIILLFHAMRGNIIKICNLQFFKETVLINILKDIEKKK